ncbi:MAG: flagellar motor protein MotA [Kiloniellales bacterium]|nr:flagellar motor protein MotA [Kiloniellales bacterium]
MTSPQRYIIRMSLFLLVVAAAAAALAPQLQGAFLANRVLNGMILGVLVLGIAYIFRQVITLGPEISWLERVRKESSGGLIYPGTLSQEKPPRLLGPMAKMLGERKGRVSLSALSMRSLLDGIQSRIEESHDISRYMIGLLIFLGLLGTFWGLLETVDAVGNAIAGLSGNVADPVILFEDLKSGLETPLSGMGTAFSSSLFGLAGSLVLGFLELQAGQAHNRFVNDLEEWLSGVTRLSSAGSLGDGEQSVPAYIQALLEQTADSLDNLQRTVARGEEDRVAANNNLMTLTERLGTLTDQMRTEQGVLLRLAETQSQLKPLLMQLAEIDLSTSGIDEATRGHIRNLDFHMERLIGEVSHGRDHTVQEIRSEIRLLARTIAAIAEEEQS